MKSGRRKNPMSRKTVIKIVVVVLLLTVFIAGLILFARSKVKKRFADSDSQEVLSAQVEVGNISTTVTGSGTLANQESEERVIPSTVDVTEIYVKAGQNVKKGDMLASVNSASVLEAMAETQEALDALDQKIAQLEDEDPEESIKAGVDGRVKKIYAKTGEKVSNIMYEHSALMLISIDGYMAIDIESDSLKTGDEVTVITSKGSSLEGTVSNTWSGKATILVTDNGTKLNDKVTVKKSGKKVGSGKLYIHESLAITGYTGTIDAIKVTENEKVSSSKVLMTLDDTSNTINYATLLEQREDLEETLHDLVVIYKEGAVYAESKGLVTSITETENNTTTTTVMNTTPGSNNNGGTTTTTSTSAETEDTIIAICPTDEMIVELSVDETDILSLDVGQEAKITIDSLGEDTYTGKITDLDTVGTSSDGVTTYTATVTLEKEEGMLSGMTASAVITIEGKENALLIPSDAVHQTSSTSYVYTSYNEESGEFDDMAEVTVGLSNGNYTEITEGLSEGDTVYYTKVEEDPFQNMSAPGGFKNMPGGDMPSGFGGSKNRPSGTPGGSGMPSPPN